MVRFLISVLHMVLQWPIVRQGTYIPDLKIDNWKMEMSCLGTMHIWTHRTWPLRTQMCLVTQTKKWKQLYIFHSQLRIRVECAFGMLWRKPFTNVLYLRTFGMPGIRPDARRVSKARPLSQDQQNAELAVRHLSVPMQDCWSQYWTVHSDVHGWYQTDRHLRIHRGPMEVYRHL